MTSGLLRRTGRIEAMPRMRRIASAPPGVAPVLRAITAGTVITLLLYTPYLAAAPDPLRSTAGLDPTMHPAVSNPAVGTTASSLPRPIELSLGSRWHLSLNPLQAPAPQFADAPTSRITYLFKGGAASLSRGPEPDGHDLPDEPPTTEAAHSRDRDGTARARGQLRAALAAWWRAGGSARTFEIGTEPAQLHETWLAAFPSGSGFSRSVGLDLLSIQFRGSGDGHFRFGRRFGSDFFVTLEPGIGRSEHRARMQYRLANWLELRLEAGDLSQRVEMVAALPLR
jgi:hypothetical protein